MRYLGEFAGEFVGTGLLVFFGCGSLAASVLFSAHLGLMQVALCWGLGVALAIYATRHLSCAHLNPAVSLAMVLGGRMDARKLPVYLAAQFVGAFCSSGLLYLLLGTSVARYEHLHGIVRGAPESVRTAMLFGEFYPNPGAGPAASVSMATAFGAEAVGTFILVFLIFALTEGCNLGRPDDSLAPLFIGFTVTVVIAVLAPLTQAGLNPARDFGPRLFAVLAGWGKAALPDRAGGFAIVYILGPIAGGLGASAFFTRFVEPLMKNKHRSGACQCG